MEIRLTITARLSTQECREEQTAVWRGRGFRWFSVCPSSSITSRKHVLTARIGHCISMNNYHRGLFPFLIGRKQMRTPVFSKLLLKGATHIRSIRLVDDGALHVYTLTVCLLHRSRMPCRVVIVVLDSTNTCRCLETTAMLKALTNS